MNTKQNNLLQHFRRGRSGATAIEYAITLPVVLALVMGTLEYSIMLYTRSSIEHATANVARMAASSAAFKSSYADRDGYYQGLLERSVRSVVIFKDNVEVPPPGTFLRWGDWRSNMAEGGPSFGQPYRIMEYKVYYTHQFLTPLPWVIMSLFGSKQEQAGISQIRIISTAMIQNEGV